LTGFSDAKFTMIAVYGQGDLITKHWRFQGTHDGKLFGILASNNKVDLYGVALVVMKDGKVF
jgi:predicted ester cyclase